MTRDVHKRGPIKPLIDPRNFPEIIGSTDPNALNLEGHQDDQHAIVYPKPAKDAAQPIREPEIEDQLSEN